MRYSYTSLIDKIINYTRANYQHYVHVQCTVSTLVLRNQVTRTTSFILFQQCHNLSLENKFTSRDQFWLYSSSEEILRTIKPDQMLSEGSEALSSSTPNGTATTNSDGKLKNDLSSSTVKERVYESEYEITFVRVAYCDYEITFVRTVNYSGHDANFALQHCWLWVRI